MNIVAQKLSEKVYREKDENIKWSNNDICDFYFLCCRGMVSAYYYIINIVQSSIYYIKYSIYLVLELKFSKEQVLDY